MQLIPSDIELIHSSSSKAQCKTCWQSGEQRMLFIVLQEDFPELLPTYATDP